MTFHSKPSLLSDCICFLPSACTLYVCFQSMVSPVSPPLKRTIQLRLSKRHTAFEPVTPNLVAPTTEVHTQLWKDVCCLRWRRGEKHPESNHGAWPPHPGQTTHHCIVLDAAMTSSLTHLPVPALFRLQCILSRAANPNFESPATSLLGPQSSKDLLARSKSTVVSRFHHSLGTWPHLHPSLHFFLLQPHRLLLCTDHPTTSGPLHRPLCSSSSLQGSPTPALQVSTQMMPLSMWPSLISPKSRANPPRPTWPGPTPSCLAFPLSTCHHRIQSYSNNNMIIQHIQ